MVSVFSPRSRDVVPTTPSWVSPRRFHALVGRCPFPAGFASLSPSHGLPSSAGDRPVECVAETWPRPPEIATCSRLPGLVRARRVSSRRRPSPSAARARDPSSCISPGRPSPSMARARHAAEALLLDAPHLRRRGRGARQSPFLLRPSPSVARAQARGVHVFAGVPRHPWRGRGVVAPTLGVLAVRSEGAARGGTYSSG